MEQLLNRVSSRMIVLDVGANSGQDGLRLAATNPSMHVIAFEPTPEMVAKIEQNYHQLARERGSLPNYTLIKSAVSDFNGSAVFNVAGQADWGCSSLNTFSENLDATWPGRTDFKVTHQIEVPVTRLDTFLASIGVSYITYLHCDTQGSDLSVLRGMGNYRKNLIRGCIECATSRSVALYKEQHVLEDVCFEFARWGYEIERLQSNDVHLNEVNIHFTNKYHEARPI